MRKEGPISKHGIMEKLSTRCLHNTTQHRVTERTRKLSQIEAYLTRTVSNPRHPRGTNKRPWIVQVYETIPPPFDRAEGCRSREVHF